MTRTLQLLASASVAAACASAAGAAPAVVVDIAPVHSIVARVMKGVGEPHLLLPRGATPHAYALRPSEAGALQDADIVFWVGEALTPWLAAPVQNIASGARTVAFIDAEGIRTLPTRAGGLFEEHAHGDHHEGDHDHGHGDEHEPRAEHDHGDGEDGGHHASAAAIDGHLWLDPLNASAMAHHAAEILASEDPANGEVYRANAEAFTQEVDALVAEIFSDLSSLDERGFIVFHDAYQYFEDRFDLPASGSIALHDADQPSPARMAEIQQRIAEADVSCVFAEPQFDAGLIETATEGSDARHGILDPVGTALELGPDFYPQMIRAIAEDLQSCLSPG